ncbi:MAG: hypothetical protein E7042_03765 [Lentisphaerae bacterium]|nr:hypothetical protein [Lentisphaerota bacterium]
MKRLCSRYRRINSGNQSGQVLVAGIFILIILLLLVFSGFDVYNAIRSKFKIETAQESAAIAGATWQRDSLNLIGEINLIKACSVLLEDDSNWVIPLPKLPSPSSPLYNITKALRDRIFQSRIDILTEMQTRVSFIGPLIGLAAAQQAAKANGIASIGDLDHYIENLRTSSRYREEFGGAKTHINRYAWREPYIGMIENISRNGVAVYPNSVTSTFPSTSPSELGNRRFYQAIHLKNNEISNAKGKGLYPQTGWDALKSMVYRDPMASQFANPPWWDIDYNRVAFPNESEIFTLGVGISNSTEIFSEEKRTLVEKAAANHMSSSSIEAIYNNAGFPLPPTGISLNFFSYDNSWYPSYYRNQHSDYDEEHFNYWFKGDALKRNVKEKYIYEGPAAYVETKVDLGKTTSLIHITGQSTSNSGSVRFGSKNIDMVDDISDYRPGNIAKVLGSIDERTPPIALPVVLPVFNKVSMMPTYMPIPYNFNVLRPDDDDLKRFLSWLSTKESLDDESGLPSGGSYYLEALRILVKGPQFRYYGWNPGFDTVKFDEEWKDKLAEWHENRQKEPEKYQYTFEGDHTLPGYYQEPNIFTACQCTTSCSGVVAVKDQQNGGIAYRHFIEGTRTYMVVDSKGHIVTRTESDPTRDPTCCSTYYFPSGGSGGSMSQMTGGGYSGGKSKKGKIR